MILSLNSIQLESPFDQTGECLILAELILPRNGIARRAALREFRVSKGKRSLAREPFYKKALLKERVDGSFGIKVSITRPLQHPELAKFARQLVATGIESSSDLFTSLLLRNSPFGDVLDEASEALGDAIAGTAPAFIASGGLDLDGDTLATGKLRIPLKLNDKLRTSQAVPLSARRDQRKQSAKTYKKGSTIGHITFDLFTD